VEGEVMKRTEPLAAPNACKLLGRVLAERVVGAVPCIGKGL